MLDAQSSRKARVQSFCAISDASPTRNENKNSATENKRPWVPWVCWTLWGLIFTNLPVKAKRGKQRDSCFYFFVNMSRKTIVFARLIVLPRRQKIRLVYSRPVFHLVWRGWCWWWWRRKELGNLPPVSQQVLHVGGVEKKRGRDVAQHTSEALDVCCVGGICLRVCVRGVEGGGDGVTL